MLHLTRKPLYHSLMVASSYRVCDLRNSKSSFVSFCLLPRQPMLGFARLSDDDGKNEETVPKKQQESTG